MKLLRTIALGISLVAGLFTVAPVFAAPTVTTTTTLASATNPVDVGAPIALTATVTGTNPSGNVTFKNGTATLGTVALSGTGNSRTASYIATITTAGAKSLTAVYAGDTLNITSTSAALAQTVNKLAASASLASSINPVVVGTPTVLTATITGYNPTGNVTFKNGTANLGTVALSGTGNTRTATYTATITTAGAKSLTAVYAGNTNNLTTTSAALAQTVDKANTTASVSSSLASATQGQSVTFTASVVGYTPTGNVVFKNGATTLSTKALSGTGNTRTATYANTTLGVGVHSITMDYVGNANNNASTAEPITQTILGKAPTTTALTSSANPSTSGQSITLTATASGTNPSGNVTFKNGTATLGTAALTGGVATFTTSTLAVGTRSLTAVYVGDAFNATSTSSAVSQVVTKATSTTTLTTSANPSTPGQSITLTATITGSTPAGTVTFKDGTTTIGTATISAGVATLATSTLSLGSHNLSASYAGNTNNLASTSVALSQAVTPASVATTTTLSATPNPANVGANVTLTASVSGNAPTGSVTFSDGATTLGTAPLNAGVASITTSALSAGGHSLVAQYAGDSTNLASTANVVFTVNAPGIGAMTWRYGYDAMGRPTTTMDPNGQSTYTYYDSLGRPIQIQQPANVGAATPTVTELEYNLADSLTKVTDPRSLATIYTPNGLGNVTHQNSPDSGASQYTYDAKGNVLTATDARGKVTTMTYDTLDRITSISYPTGTPTILEYDGGASPTPATRGELTRITDESGTTSYGFDSAGRLTTKTTVINGKTFTVAYTWGDAGSAIDKLTAITYPSGNRVNYSYDQYGQIAGISTNPVNPNGVGTSGATNVLLSGISTNANNNVTGWIWANGKTRTISYDNFGQIASYSLGDPTGTGTTAGSQRNLIRDAASRITGYSHTNPANAGTAAALNQGFGYDNLNRLVNATLGNSTTQYAYDATGNRTAKTIGATTYTNTVATTSNKYTQTQDANGTASIQYDAAGHITGDGTNTFTYSDRGRMATASNVGGTVNYLYNALNLRVAKTGPNALIPTGAAYYVYDEQGQLLGEYDANNNPIYETVHLGMSPVGVLKQTGTAAQNNIATSLYNVYSDHLATPRVITRATDDVLVWRWDTAEAFGATVPSQDPSSLGTFTYNPRFPGQVFDSETGLNQNWNRDYDPRQGRYRQSDPIGLGGGINTFAYVGGNPLSGVDPLGLDTVVVIGGPTKGNPFGHAAIAFPNQGVYSYGTEGALGSNLTDYLASQAKYRDSTVYVIPTTPEQEAKMLEEILKYRSTPLPNPKKDLWGAMHDTCATRTQRALEAGGVTSIFVPYISPYPAYVEGVAVRNATRTVKVPKGGAVPIGFTGFNR